MAASAFSKGALPLPVQVAGNHVPSARGASEQKLGILYTVSPVDSGFYGEARKRYTDFIVNEVRKDATVVQLAEFEEQAPIAPQPKKEYEKPQTKATGTASAANGGDDFIPPADITTLNELLGQTVAGDLLRAYSAICKGENTRGLKVALAVVQDRAARTKFHQEIRRIFFSKFETAVDPATGMITATPAASSNRRNSRAQNGGTRRDRRGAPDQKADGEYLHFTLYKENRDTMDAINNIARMLKIKSNLFGFAGTKDRRACTTQRMSVRFQKKSDFVWLNGKIPTVKLGDFSYHQKPIQLGQHGGNEFVITLKNVQVVRGNDYSIQHRLRTVETCVQQALDSIVANGFINYFGLQRFGTHAIGTHEVGMKILKGDFEAAIDMILNFDPQVVSGAYKEEELTEVFHRDEIARSRGIHTFKTTGDLDKALEILPKRFTAEQTILRHLGRNRSSQRDYCGALLAITRGLRNLYIHSYQSLVWNWVASKRWARYGDQVIKGDLVLVEMEGNPLLDREARDMSEDVNQEEEEFYQQARALSAEEAASGKYSITDIVLPIPGFDMLYPENDIGEFYAEFMGRPENGGLDPYNMRRPQREFSLAGHYRKLIAKFTAIPKFMVRPYADDVEQMHPTDLDQIKRSREDAMAASFLNPIETPNIKSEGNRRRTATDRSSAEPVEPRVNDAWIETANDGGSGSKRMKTRVEGDVTVDSAPLNGGASTSSDRQGSPIEPSPKDDVFGPSKEKSPIALLESNGAIRMVDPQDIKPRRTLSAQAAPFQPGVPMEIDLAPKEPSIKMEPSVKMEVDSTPTKPGVLKQEVDGASASPVPLLADLASEMKNYFKDQHPAKDKDGKIVERAINCTGKWRECALPEELKLKIAVVLNIRLNSSNYATVCLREMMSSAEVDEAMKVARR